MVSQLLVKFGTDDGGRLNPSVEGNPSVAIIIRITLIYTDNNASNPTQQLTLEFDVVVQPGDWNPTPCSFLLGHCIVFQNDEIIMFVPDIPGPNGRTVVSLDALSDFTAQSDVNVISTICDVRCETTSTECIAAQAAAPGANLNPVGSGTIYIRNSRPKYSQTTASATLLYSTTRT